MANLQARAVPLGSYDASAKVATDLPGPSGSAADSFAETARSFAHLSSYLNKWADEAAQEEGRTAGVAAALQQGDNLQLRRDGTLTGAAFDKAAIDARAAQLDTAARNDLFTAAQAHQDDPAAMKTAFDRLGAAYAAKAGLAPELQAHFDKRFADLRFGYETEAVRRRDGRLRAEAAASYGTAIDTALRDASRTAFVLGDAEGGDDKIAAEGRRIRQMLSHGKAAGYITPAYAEKTARDLDGELAQQKVLGAFERLDGVDAKTAFVARLKEDWAAGKALQGFDPDSFATLTNTLQTRASQQASRNAQTERAISAGVRSIRERVIAGYGVSDGEWGEIDAIAQRTAAPALQQSVRQAKAEVAQIGRWWTMKPAELATLIQAERTRIGGAASAADVARIDAAQKVHDALAKQAEADPLALAERLQRAQPTSLSPALLDGEGETVNAAFAQRRAAAEHAASEFGVAPKYFTSEERDAWAQIFNAGGPRAAQAATMFASQWGPDAATRAIAEVAPKAAVMAHAAAVVATGGSAAFSRDVARGLGYRAAQGYEPLKLPPQKVTAAASDEYGGAFASAPAAAQRAVDAARTAFDARAREQNLAPAIDAGASKTAFRRALQEAAGASFNEAGAQFGGVGLINGRKTLLPADVRASRAGDLVAAITDADLAARPPVDSAGRPLPAAELRTAALVAIGPGRYRVARGDPASDRPQWFAGRDGQPFVLDLEALRPALRARRPDLYRGGPSPSWLPWASP